ncbi:glycosyltransferase family 4 protein [Gracilimonas amylolytica]|uniref:glycosyltransferase family 4 protein n=1 Tax=Gracilimonas amylolytica TaxID=1749045 RepID=UPI000CD80D64|nr:glycosyltransferase family 4 protein [Gracilimonas amylolytica]
MKNVLLLVYYFPPLGGSGVQRPLKFVKYLREFGWNPIVVCPEPGAYPYSDHSLLDELTNIGVEVHRVTAKTPFHLPFIKGRQADISEKITELGRRLTRLLMYPDNKKGWIGPAVDKAIELSKEQRFDLIFSTAPPFSNHIAASEIKERLQIPLVLDYRDAWTNNHFMDDLFRWQKRIHSRLERDCLKNADQVIVLDEFMGQSIKQAHPKIDPKTQVIAHGYDPDDFKGTNEATLPYKPGKLNLLYSGLFYESNQPDILLRAIDALNEASAINMNDIHLHFQGGLTPRINKLVNGLGLGNSVTDLGYVTHINAVSNLMKADALWMISNFDPVHKQVKSGKLFEYLGTGKPVLGLVHEGAELETLKSYGAGYTAPPDDLEAVKEALLSLYNDWKQKALKQPKKAYMEQFDRRKLTQSLSDVFDSLTSQ